jgi:hypothetical protein
MPRGVTLRRFDSQQMPGRIEFECHARRMHVGPAGEYTTPMQTVCSGSGYYVTCSTVGGNYVPPVYAPVDQNAGSRNGALDSCILARGWRKDHETFLGMTVKTY